MLWFISLPGYVPKTQLLKKFSFAFFEVWIPFRILPITFWQFSVSCKTLLLFHSFFVLTISFLSQLQFTYSLLYSIITSTFPFRLCNYSVKPYHWINPICQLFHESYLNTAQERKKKTVNHADSHNSALLPKFRVFQTGRHRQLVETQPVNLKNDHLHYYELEGDEQKWSLCVTHGNSRYCSWNLSSRLQVWNVYYFHNIKNTYCLVESIIQKTGLVSLLFYTYSLHKSQLTFRTWRNFASAYNGKIKTEENSLIFHHQLYQTPTIPCNLTSILYNGWISLLPFKATSPIIHWFPCPFASSRSLFKKLNLSSVCVCLAAISDSLGPHRL